MEQKVIDVSYHNGVIDWQKVKDAGWHAILRLGYGDDIAKQDDAQWARNVSECERLGIPHGAYFYSYAKTDEQIESEIAHARRLLAGHTLQYPAYFDSEHPGTEKRAREFAARFCDAMQQAGYWAGVYAGNDWFGDNLAGLTGYTLWIARYGGRRPDVACDMWQYAEEGHSVPGVNGKVDVNVCYRDFPAEIGGKPAGWVQDGDRWWYRHADGSCTRDGWEQVGGEWYLFDGDGWMRTGWAQYDGEWYWLHDQHDGRYGAMDTGWVQVDGKWYYLTDSGAMATGWLDKDGKWYYLDPSSGAMHEADVASVGGKWYAFGDSGEMLYGVGSDAGGALKL